MKAETAKAIENTKRFKYSLFNEILILSKNLNFNEIIKLAATKWNFVNFARPKGPLPVDPYYLSTLQRKINLQLIRF